MAHLLWGKVYFQDRYAGILQQEREGSVSFTYDSAKYPAFKKQFDQPAGEAMERNIYLNWQALVEEAIKRRKAQRLSQEQLAILSGVSKPTLNRFEQGQTTITLENAMKILKVLGLVEISS